jgi:hypothetical protein
MYKKFKYCTLDKYLYSANYISNPNILDTSKLETYLNDIHKLNYDPIEERKLYVFKHQGVNTLYGNNLCLMWKSHRLPE